MYTKGKGKTVPLQAWTEGSRKLRFLDFMASAQDGGKANNVHYQI